jgi:hypothetical protein
MRPAAHFLIAPRMDNNKKIVIEPGFLLERIDNEIAVYHPTKTLSVYLNESGALIWELCDGSRSAAEIIALLTELYPDSSGEIPAQVEDLVRQLLDSGIAELRG